MNTTPYRLRLTPDNEHEVERERVERDAQYRRRYWQEYKKTHVRVFGTLSTSDHANMKAIADANGRPVWTQIWMESCAYRRAEFLPAPEIVARQDRMIAELRRIGNNLNQLARQGYVGRLPHGAQDIGDAMEALEAEIIAFTRHPWLKPASESQS